MTDSIQDTKAQVPRPRAACIHCHHVIALSPPLEGRPAPTWIHIATGWVPCSLNAEPPRAAGAVPAEPATHNTPHRQRKDAAECPRCNGLGGGYVRTGPDDQWDSEECDWCWGAGYIPAALADALRAAPATHDTLRKAALGAAHELDLNAIWFKNHGYPTTAISSSDAADKLRAAVAAVDGEAPAT